MLCCQSKITAKRGIVRGICSANTVSRLTDPRWGATSQPSHLTKSVTLTWVTRQLVVRVLSVKLLRLVFFKYLSHNIME